MLAWLFLGEPIGLRQGGGLLVALLGILLVQLPVGVSGRAAGSPEAGGRNAAAGDR